MKSIQYFLFIRQRKDRAIIKDEWILEIINKLQKTEIQSAERIRKWKYLKEVRKSLRVILLEDGEMVHNALSARNGFSRWSFNGYIK